MKPEQRRQEILQQINAITRMERGKLWVQSRGPASPVFHKLQCWHKGRNQTRYVPEEEVAAVREALSGHERFQQMAEEFVDLTIAQTQASDAERKKLQEVQAERYQETEAFLKLFGQRLEQGQKVTAEWMEAALRGALLEDGRRLLETLVARLPALEAPPQSGQRVYRWRACQALRIFGPITLRRDYYHPPGPEVVFPLMQPWA